MYEKKITREFISEIVAMLLREEYYDDFEDSGFFTKENEKGEIVVYVGTEERNTNGTINEEREMIRGIIIPEEIDKSSVENEIFYIAETDRQICMQAQLPLISEDLKFLGSYSGRGGIEYKDIKIILNWIDLYDVYFKGEKIATDIYFDELADVVWSRL